VKALRRWLGIRVLADWREVPDSGGRTLLLKPAPKPGWYLLSVRCTADQKRCFALLNGAQGLGLVSGRWRRRVVRIRRSAPQVRLCLEVWNGAFQLTGLRLTPLSLGRRGRLLRRKLHRLHPLHAPGNAPARGRLDRQWRDYNRVLARGRWPLIGYDAWLALVESPWLERERAAAAAAPRPPEAGPQVPVALWCWGEQVAPPLQLCSEASWQQQWPGSFHALAGMPEDPPPRWLLVLQRGDRLAPQALRRFAAALAGHPGARLLYADEDRLEPSGRRHSPQFKPAWNPDLFYADPHYSHCWLMAADLHQEACHRLAEAGRAPDLQALLLEATALCLPEQIVHLPEVLYHRLVRPGELRGEARSAAVVAAHLGRRGESVEVRARAGGGHRLQWALPSVPPLVSVIIPTRDRADLLQRCLESLERHAPGNPPCELVLIDNGSTQPEALALLGRLEARANLQVLRRPGPFNYAALNNGAVTMARGEVLAFLNNDVEALHDGWLRPLVAHALRPSIGAVGARLLFDDGSVQHGGVILGIGGVAGHAHKYLAAEAPGYQLRLQLCQNVSAVTAAALVVRRDRFEALGGFDQHQLAVNYNDVDFCLRLLQAGYRNLYCPDSVLVHHESKSRGAPTRKEDVERWQRERQVMQGRWGERLLEDPAYSPHLSLLEEDFSLALRARRGRQVCMPAARSGRWH
jgi:GT2 family glycosyltransferase